MPYTTLLHSAPRSGASWARMGLAALLALASAAVSAQSVRILEPKDGATVPGTFKVRMEARGVTAEAAGSVVAGRGHHHVLVNMGPIEPGEEIPFTRRHIHLSHGQSEIDLKLQPGTYKLTVQFADGEHKSLGPKLAHTITVTVQ